MLLLIELLCERIICEWLLMSTIIQVGLINLSFMLEVLLGHRKNRLALSYIIVVSHSKVFHLILLLGDHWTILTLSEHHVMHSFIQYFRYISCYVGSGANTSSNSMLNGCPLSIIIAFFHGFIPYEICCFSIVLSILNFPIFKRIFIFRFMKGIILILISGGWQKQMMKNVIIHHLMITCISRVYTML